MIPKHNYFLWALTLSFLRILLLKELVCNMKRKVQLKVVYELELM